MNRRLARVAALSFLALIGGCGGDDPSGRAASAPAAAPASTVLEFGRDDRPAIVASVGLEDARAFDLVVAFHGRTNSNADARGYFDLEAHARRPTLFVYPSAKPVRASPRAWWKPGDPPAALRDYALFDAIVAEMDRRYRLAPGRVFVVGHSLGASFANSLACARGDEIRAVASVAGGINPSTCRGQTAALLVHHPDDDLVPLADGLAARDVLLRQNRLDGERPSRVALSDFSCQRWGGASDPIYWCLHAQDRSSSGRYYPHRWPSTAGEAIMRLFDSLP